MRRKKIVIIDDSMDSLTFVRTLLNTSGYTAYVAKNGDEGMKKILKHKPDLVLLDVMMPIEGGIEMYRRLRNDKELKDIPVVFLSAVSRRTFKHCQYILDSYKQENIPEPEEYIEKPVEADELLEVVKRYV